MLVRKEISKYLSEFLKIKTCNVHTYRKYLFADWPNQGIFKLVQRRVVDQWARNRKNKNSRKFVTL
jgi:hypothetical protein